MGRKSWFIRAIMVGLVVEALLIIGLIASSSAPSTVSVPTLASLPTSVANADVPDAAMAPQDSEALVRENPSPAVPEPVAEEAPPPGASSQVETEAPPTAVPTLPPFPSPTPLSQAQPILPSVEIPQEPLPNQVIITFAPDASQQAREAYIAQLGGEVKQSIDALDAVVVEVSADVAAEPLPQSASVAQSEPDYLVTAQIDIPPSDPLYPQQWALRAIGAPDAWLELPVDAPQVIVAVIDSGICADHPDLQGRILPGWDFVEDDAEPQDAFGHGCGVAGIIAANVDDGIGMAGVAPNAMVLPLRVLDASGVGAYSDVAAAIVRATDDGAQVINLSLGGAFPSTVLENAITYAIDAGVTVVAAAGNTGSEQVLYPAAYEPVIAVGAVDEQLQPASFSARGDSVDIWAPGQNVVTTQMSGGHAPANGTSFAAPYVSGVAVLGGELAQALNVGTLVRTPEVPTTDVPTLVVGVPSSTPPQISNEHPLLDRVFLASQLEYGPTTDPFDTSAYLETVQSALQYANVPTSSGQRRLAEVIEDAGLKHGINPRVIIAFIQAQTGILLTPLAPTPDQLNNPLGLSATTTLSGFEQQVDWLAGLLRTELVSRQHNRDHQLVRFFDGSTTSIGYEIPSGNFVILAGAAALGPSETWNARYREFLDTFDSLVSSGMGFAITSQVTFPTMVFPFAGTQRYAGGPHDGIGHGICSAVNPSASAIDFAAQTPGNWFPVLNVADGILRNVHYIDTDSDIDFGWTVSVELLNSNGLDVLYAHLNLSSDDVARLQALKNSPVPRGYIIGNAGQSGNQDSVHLHLDLRTGGTTYDSYATIGSPVGWDGHQIDGWGIYLHRIGENGSLGYNYQGSAVRGQSKTVLIDAYCGSGATSWATVGVNYNRVTEVNEVDPNTIFAQTDTTSKITSSNSPDNGTGTTIVWTGASVDNPYLWNEPENWLPQREPTVTDNVLIDVQDNDITVEITGESFVSGLQSLENLRVSSGSLTINGTSILGRELDLRGGTVTVNGNLTIGGQFLWSGGTLTGQGIVHIAQNASLSISGTLTKSLLGISLVNAGTASWSDSGMIVMGSDAVLRNLGGASFEALNNGSFTPSGTGRVGTFVNSGLFRVNAGIGSATTFGSGIDFFNFGTVEVSVGNLLNIGGGLGSGIFRLLQAVGGAGTSEAQLDPAEMLALDATQSAMTLSSYTLEDGGAILGEGSLSGNITFNGNTSIDGTISLSGSQTVTGVLTINTSVTWTDASLSGSGTTRIAPGATLTISGTNVTSIYDGHTLENAGRINWIGTHIYLYGNATVNNLAGATFDVQVGTDIYDGNQPTGGTINNAGTFLKSYSGGTSVGSGVMFNNTGIVEVNASWLTITQGSGSGLFRVLNDSNLVLAPYTLEDGAAIQGIGTLHGSPTTSTGSISIDGDIIFNAVNLSVAGELAVNGNLTLVDAGLSGSGTTRIAPGATLTISGTNVTSIYDGHTLENAGRINWIGTHIYLYGNATVNNLAGATFDVQVGTDIYDGNQPTGGTINNAGTFLKSYSGGTSVGSGVMFNNTGIVEVNASWLTITQGSGSGLFRVLNDSNLVLAPYTLEDGAAIQGIGTLHGSPTTSTGSISIDGDIIFNAVNLSVAGELAVNGNLTLVDAGLSGSGTTRIAPGATLTISGTNVTSIYDGHTLENAGRINWIGTHIYLYGNATVNNLAGATFDVQVGTDIYDGNQPTGGTINNAGTFLKSYSGGTSVGSGVMFNNTGTVEVNASWLTITQGSGSGLFRVLNDSNLVLAPYTLEDGAAIQGIGTLHGSPTTSTGSISIDGDIIFNAVNLSVAGELAVNGNLTLVDAGLSGSGTTRIAPGATLTISGANVTSIYDGHTLENAGRINWIGTHIYLYGNATVNNLAGATFDVQVGTDIYDGNQPTGGTINNAGTFVKSAGVSTGLSISQGVTFSNAGTVESRVGTLTFGDNYVQTAGTTSANGGNIYFNQPLNIQGGILSGISTVTANVTNSGIVQPGTSPGILSLTGTYTQTSAGGLTVEIGGLTAGTEYDRFAVSGQATLGGALNVSLINGFVPNVGDSFQVMTFASRVGEFAIVTGLDIGQGLQFDVVYNPTYVTLTVVGAATASVDVTFTIAGGHATHTLPLEITLVDPVTSAIVMQQNLTSTGDATSGHFNLSGVTPGTYDLYVKGSNTLRSMQSVTLAAGSNAVSFTALRSGDANGDNLVDISDFSILALHFLTVVGDTNFDARPDFNGDGVVDISDFSMLALNFLTVGVSLPPA